jgi:hypothetical protein
MPYQRAELFILVLPDVVIIRQAKVTLGNPVNYL